MIRIQVLNDILNNNNLNEYLEKGINEDYFRGYEEEFNFIVKHNNKYGKCPDLATFAVNFPNFEVVEVLEPVNYLIDEIKEQYVYDQGVSIFQESARILEGNSYEGLEHIISKAQELLKNSGISQGTDINRLTDTKLDDIRSKEGLEGMLGISSGMPEIDKILGGWLPGEELVTIVGRVNQGKSWILQKFLSEAHNQGKKVLHYSGEMGVLQVAYRHDTSAINYSNKQLMRGTITTAELKQYEKDLKHREETLQPYIVITPKDLGGKMLTISTLRALIQKYEPDIVGIDQLSLMKDERGKGEPNRIQLSHLTMDLFNLSTEFSIPILADAQAKRNKADEENPENPDLDDIGESDGIGQNSSRVISLVQTKAGLSLYIAKNRFGDKGAKLIYSWDIDNGLYRFIDTEENTKQEQTLPIRNATKQESKVTDVF